MQKQIIFLLAGMIFNFSVIAQKLLPAKIITNQQDTISGQVEKPEPKVGFQEIKFTQTDKSALRTYSANELQGVVIHQDHFLSVSTSDHEDRVFLQALVLGQARLLSDLNSKGENIYYFQKAGEKAFQFNKSHPGGFLAAFFADCEKLSFNQKKKIYPRNELIDATNSYNQCINPEEQNIEIAEMRNTFRLVPGMRGVYSINQFESGLNVLDYSNGSYTMGANLFLTLDFGGALSIQPELTFINYKAEVKESAIQARTYDSYVLHLPVLAKYDFNIGKINPYIFAAPQINLQITSDAYLIEYNYEGGLITKSKVKTAPRVIGFCAGAGLSYPIGKLKLNAEFRYSNYTFESQTFALIIHNYNCAQFLVGLSF